MQNSVLIQKYFGWNVKIKKADPKTHTDNGASENVSQFKYMGNTQTNVNSIREEISSALNSRNAGYQSVQKMLTSCLP